MNSLVFSFLLVAFVVADSSIEDKVGNFFGGLAGKAEDKLDDTIDKVESHAATALNSICSPAPERPLKSIEAEIVEAWESVVKAVTLISGIPKVVYDETIDQAVKSYEDIKGDATKMVTDINIEMPQIPKSVDLDFGELGIVNVPLS